MLSTDKLRFLRLATSRHLKAVKAFSTGGAHQTKPFDKILIANRGEIACRIIKTARKLGVKTVAVYSEADAAGMHVRMADEAYCIGPAQSKDSYLKMERILDIAKKTGAQGIHPGYGFLSENAKFADMVESAGIAFIGPSSHPMNAMGDKINSKIIAKKAGVNVIPGFDGEVESEDHAVALAKEVGFPVMIKASAGGGGKGMRVAYDEKEVRDGFRLSKAEAMSSFGDDRMLIERFIEDPHHIEIQVVADTFGNVVAFPERECSVQRRNQKVVEESPSCLLSPETRKAMQAQAIALCKAVGYRSAGTIEMLADGKQNFFFLEMNTRLQVEHPITELVSGEDLVAHMLWVAAGKALPERLTKNPFLTAKGWALESRVYAEDPLRNFLPSIGPLITYRQPPLLENDHRGAIVRLDTGVYEGGEISMYYDPMIAKLCTHAPTRKDAISAMEEALDRYVVSGLGNNICFLRSVYRNSAFRSGKYGTKFIPEQYPNGFHGVELTEPEIGEMLTGAVSLELSKRHQLASMDNYKYALPPSEADEHVFMATVNRVKDEKKISEVYEIKTSSGEEGGICCEITRQGGSAPQLVRAVSFNWMIGDPLFQMDFLYGEKGEGPADTPYSRDLQYEGRSSHGGYLVRHLGAQNEVILRSKAQHHASSYMLPPEVKDTSKFLLCPMPGTVVSVSVTAGQHVQDGQQLAVVEAMKMQNVLRATKAGTIKSVLVKPGTSLKVDQVILEFNE